MNQKSIEYYLGLKYPVAFQQTEDGFELWHPDFGRYSIVSVNKSLARAIKELDAARAATIEFLFERGLEVPEPETDDEVFSGRFVVRVPKDLHRSLAREAFSNGVSLNSYVIHLLSERQSADLPKSRPKARTPRRKAAVNGNGRG